MKNRNQGAWPSAVLLLALGSPSVLGATAFGQASQQSLEHLQAGAAHLQHNEVDQAIRECKAAVAADPQSAPAHMLLGEAYLATGSFSVFAEAVAELRQALDIDPKLLWARFYLARCYMDLGRYDRAQQELEQGLAEHPDVPHFLSLLGEVNRKQGHPEKSVELNGKAIELDPSLTPAHYYRALAYIDLKQDDLAFAELEKSVQSKYVAPEMYLTLGMLYARRGKFAEAEDAGKKAIALDPSRSESYLALAQICNLHGKSDEALAAIRTALPEGKSFPSSPYYQQLQADLFFEQGRAYQAKHQTPEAIRSYSRALEFDPSRGKAHQQMAVLFAATGNLAQARVHASMAEKLGSPVDAALRQQIHGGQFESTPHQP